MADLSKWLTRAQAQAELFNCSSKTLDRYHQKQLLASELRTRAGLVAVRVYEPESVKRLKAAMTAERDKQVAPATVHSAEDTPETTETTDTALPVARPTSLEPVLAALSRLPRQWALYLSWTDARHYTGLSETCLRAAVKDGLVATRAYGRGVRLRRRDLDRL